MGNLIYCNENELMEGGYFVCFSLNHHLLGDQ